MTWKKGESGNAKGRPKSGTSLAEAIRRSIDPEKLMKQLEDIADNSPSDQTRLRAIEMLMERGWKKPAQTIEVGPADPYEDMSDEDLLALRASLAARLAGQDVDGRLLKAPGHVLDVDAEPSEAAATPSLETPSAETCDAGAHVGARPTAHAGVLVRRRAGQDEDTDT